jgi:hypothetical protein
MAAATEANAPAGTRDSRRWCLAVLLTFVSTFLIISSVNPGSSSAGGSPSAAPMGESPTGAEETDAPRSSIDEPFSAGDDPDDILASPKAGPSAGSDDDDVWASLASINKRQELPPTAYVREFFKNVLVLHMISPSRYGIVEKVRDHYAPFFPLMLFIGPHNDTNTSVHIHGYDVAWGNQQARAVSRVMQHLEAVNKYPNLEGYLYIADDLMLQPWGLVSFNKSKIWATQMGIGNTYNGRPINGVVGMSMERKFRVGWPYWKKNRPRLAQFVHEAGEEVRENLYKSAKATHPSIYRQSAYRRSHTSDEALRHAVFYTIVDTYYIPRRYALRFAQLTQMHEKLWTFGEAAIPTCMRGIDPEYEQMHVQFYWSTLNAADCPRVAWGPAFSGFHRCRHDHFFAEALYDETNRTRLVKDQEYRRAMLKN